MFRSIVNRIAVALAHWSYHRKLFHFESEIWRGALCARPDDDIDHIVSLRNAWAEGAAAWTPEKRKAFANDEGNLWVLKRHLNEAKGDRTMAEYSDELPNEFTAGQLQQIARCTTQIKTKYDLPWSEGEWAAVRE